ncbi:MAG: ABC transporter substrate-binding protein [Chloroflexi bacterium]|nr:ABC transporter substrate-binding protein [Chloroflexota bacterium]
MKGTGNYWTQGLHRAYTRREVLRGAAKVGLGIAGLSVIGCAAAPAPSTPAKAPAASPAAQATPTAPQPVYGGTIVHPISTNMGFDPGITVGSGYDMVLIYHVYNSLLHTSQGGLLEPELATSWEIPDLTTIVFKLRPDKIKFHDGADFNAQAVKVNFDRIIAPGFKATQAVEVANNLKSTDAVDERTVKLTLKSPYPPILDRLTGMSGGITSPNTATKYNNDLRQKGVGTGPFVAKEWVMDDHVTVEKFPDYWEKGLPYVDKVTWRNTPDPIVSQTMLRTGEAQFILDVPTKDVPSLKQDPNIVVVNISGPGAKRKVLHLNMMKEPFSKKAARQALAYAIDRQAVSSAVYGGLLPPADDPFPTASWAHDPTIKNYPYDPQKAKEKLVEAGYPNGFEFKAVTAPVRPDEVQASEVIQNMLAKVGIKMSLLVVENPKKMDIWKEDTKEFDAIGVVGAGSAQDPIYLLEKYYTRKGDYANIKVPFPEVEDLIDKAKQTYKLEEQKPLLQKAARLLTEEVWAEYGIVYETIIVAHRKELKNYAHGPHPFYARFRKVWLSK